MQPTTEMQFGRDDSPTITIASAFADGQVTITVQNQEVPGHACDNELALAQVIQLRDFLNRQIDSLALTATGADATRSSDDPASLPAVSMIERRLPDLVRAVDAPAGVLHLVWNPSKTICVGFYDPGCADHAETGVQINPNVTHVGRALREGYELSEGDTLPRTTVTFY